MNTNKTVETIVHLVASPFLGGPERQMLGLAAALPAGSRSVFLCYMENGKGQAFVDAVRAAGHTAIALRYNFPYILRSAREVAQHLRELHADVLLTHNYKPNLIGLLAARRCHVPIIAVSRGWTWATLRVRLYEAIDRRMLRWMDRVVCVSEGQAVKVRKAGVAEERVEVVRNSVNVDRFARSVEGAEKSLRSLIPRPVSQVVLAVGRLSPEKGFDDFIEAARMVLQRRADVGFVIIGDGPLKKELQSQINAAGLKSSVMLSGFRNDVDQLLPHATLLVQSSHTEGMPNVVLEAMAASVPVVATSVGGTPELIVHGESGYLVPAGDAEILSEGMLSLLGDSMERARIAAAARLRVEEQFSFASQAASYERLFGKLLARRQVLPGRRMEMVAGA